MPIEHEGIEKTNHALGILKLIKKIYVWFILKLYVLDIGSFFFILSLILNYLISAEQMYCLGGG